MYLLYICINTVISERKVADFELEVVQKNCMFNNDVRRSKNKVALC